MWAARPEHRTGPTARDHPEFPFVVDPRNDRLEPTECRGLGKSGKPDYARDVQALPHDGWGSSKPSQAELFRQRGSSRLCAKSKLIGLLVCSSRAHCFAP